MRGAWKASRTPSTDVGSEIDGTTPERHARTDWTAAGAEPPYAAPRQAAVSSAIADDGLGYDPVSSAEAPGRRLNREPVTHDDPAVPRGRGAHQVDRGAPEQRRRYTTLERSDLTMQLEQRVTELSPSSSRAATIRGANGQPENNPDGFRIGRRMFTWQLRRMPRRTTRHDVRPLRSRLAVSPRATNPPPGGSSRYSSPFPDVTSIAGRIARVPMLRRQPGPWDESLLSDGVTDDAVVADVNQYWRP